MARGLPALLAVSVLTGAVLPATRSPAGDPRIAVLPAVAKVRPGDHPSGASQVNLTLLRGECEMAHLAVTAGASPLQVWAHATLDAAPGLHVLLFREALVSLTRASGPDGDAGLWPDPLIPKIDPYVGEARRAFPLDIDGGRSGSILVRVCAEPQARPGVRRGAVNLKLGTAAVVVPLTVTLLPFSIPTTATIPTTFGLASRSAALGHLGRPANQGELLRFDGLYRDALLTHRISAHGGTWDPPSFSRTPGGELHVDFTDYDREVGPFLSGSARTGGARATTLELRTHPDLKTDDERIAYWRAQVKHLEEKDWHPILFDYEKDEPHPEDLPAIAAHARLVKQADPSIRVLVTSTISPTLSGLVNLWTPNLNCLFMKRSPHEFCPSFAAPSAYSSALAGGAQLWWYQSCSSHGCDDGPRRPYFAGWPSYVVDAQGARARAMGWLAFLHDIGGELYWSTTAAYTRKEAPADPWAPDGLWLFGGNGDGTLFYPGTPERIGGKSDVPVDSLRLELIREGLEDYELLREVAKLPGGAKVAREAAVSVAPDVFRISADPQVFDRARARLLAFLRQHPSE